MQKLGLQRIILQGSEYIQEMEQILALAYSRSPEYVYARDTSVPARCFMVEVLNGLIESIRDDEKSRANVYWLVHRINDFMRNMFRLELTTQQRFNVLVYDLGISLHDQAKRFGMYDADGKLAFSYYRIDEVDFKDVAVNSILQLQWNGRYHEPIV